MRFCRCSVSLALKSIMLLMESDQVNLAWSFPYVQIQVGHRVLQPDVEGLTLFDHVWKCYSIFKSAACMPLFLRLECIV